MRNISERRQKTGGRIQIKNHGDGLFAEGDDLVGSKLAEAGVAEEAEVEELENRQGAQGACSG
jgi:hypothetical protein